MNRLHAWGFALLFFSLEAKDSWLVTTTSQQMGIVESIITDTYGPMGWKKEQFSLDFEREVAKAKALLQSNPPLTLREAQGRLTRLLNELKDYHVSIQFYSTESASLPFSIKKVEGKWLVTSIRAGSYGLHVGDEILSFDGVAIERIAQVLLPLAGRKSNPATDLALVEETITSRVGAMGFPVPKGNVTVAFRSNGSHAIKNIALAWNYHKEEIPPPFLGKMMAPIKMVAPKLEKPKTTFSLIEERTLPFYSLLKNENMDSPYSIGSQSSMINFSKAKWKTESDRFFQAAIFQGHSGEKIGFLRIPSFVWDGGHNYELQELIRFLEKNTDLLVVDVMNNPGGQVINLYTLLSHFATRPLQLFQEQRALTQEDVSLALKVLKEIEEARQGHLATGDLTDEWIAHIEAQSQFFIQEWTEGRTWTQLHYNFNFQAIEPHKEAVYTKPLLVLANEGSFSCADFFPAFLKANKRAKIMGSKTAGAGGAIKKLQFTSNLLGVASITYTISLLYDEKGKPVENVGISPDIPYTISIQDILSNGEPFKKRLLEEASNMINK